MIWDKFRCETIPFFSFFLHDVRFGRGIAVLCVTFSFCTSVLSCILWFECSHF